MGDHKNDDELAKTRRSSAGKSLLMVGKSTQFLGRSQTAVKIMVGLGRQCALIRDRTFEGKSRLRMRRPSYGFGSVPGIAPVRSSHIALEFRRPALVYLPTYQLDPKTKFHLATVLKMINEEMDEHFTDHRYNVQHSPAMALKMAANLVKWCKENFDRYRIICVVTIGQRRAQSITTALSMLWDHERDDYADVSRENTTCFLQATIIGIYFD